MKIMSVVGARPNFMKVAPIIAAIREHNANCAPEESVDHILVHTGQHYDRLMSVGIPMMSISHSDLMSISSERSDAGLSQCGIVIDTSQEFCLFSFP